MYEGGLRAAEPGVMKVSYLRDLNKGDVYVHRGKGSKAGWVTVTPKTRSILRKWVRHLGAEHKNSPWKAELRPDDPLFPGYKGQGITPLTVRRAWQAVATAAGLHKDLHRSHVLKRSRCQHILEAAEANGDHPSTMFGVIADIVGHAQARTTIEHYTKTSGQARKRVLENTIRQEEP
jgi:integrase